VGDFIRARREAAKLSVRRLARLAGVSNPYLSQIERGLRRPSADVLAQLAKALRLSAETMYIQAGILDPDSRADTSVPEAIALDGHLTPEQKRHLLDLYDRFSRTASESVTGAER
jgi:transcriptional regulator with XRE-family HTH domain